MWSEADHMNGFEKEAALVSMHGNFQVYSRLYSRSDFMEVARVVNPILCFGVFSRRSCVRKLKYIGYDNFDINLNFLNMNYVYGEIYHSIDFNGATYTIQETGLKIGMAYFEVVA